MRQPPPVIRRGVELLAKHLLRRKHIPQAELRSQTPIRLLGHRAGDKRLGTDLAPVAESRGRVHAHVLLNEARRIERPEQAGPFQVGRNDVGHVGGQLAVAALGGKRRQCNRQRFDVALGNIDFDKRCRRQRSNHHKRSENKCEPSGFPACENRKFFQYSAHEHNSSLMDV